VKRNILVLRRCSLVRVSNRPCYTSLALLTSSYPSRRTETRTSYNPRRPSTDISMSLRTASHCAHRAPAQKSTPLTNSLGGA
jgi:hypothetical protein